MCQAIQNGGRRCPQHQHAQQAFFNVIKAITILKDKQVSTLFTSLRREALGRQRATSTERSNANLMEAISTNSSLSAEEKRNLELDTQNSLTLSDLSDEELDVRTRYARNVIYDRAVTLSDNLESALEDASARTGRPLNEVKAQFWEVYNNTDTTRNAEAPASYTQTRRREYFDAGLPYDRSTINALETVKSPPQTPSEPILVTQRRIPTLTPPPVRSHIRGMGYHEGRLEILFGAGTPYAYRNIPPTLWAELSTSSSPGTVFSRSIRNNQEYQYASQEEGEADGYITNCQTCGQFVGNDGSHLCPVPNAPQTDAPVIVSELSATSEPSEESPVLLHEGERIRATRTTIRGMKVYEIVDTETGEVTRESLGSHLTDEHRSEFPEMVVSNPRKLQTILKSIRSTNDITRILSNPRVTSLDPEIQKFNRFRAITSFSRTPPYFRNHLRNVNLEVPIKINFGTKAQELELGIVNSNASTPTIPVTHNVFVEEGEVTGSIQYKRIPANVTDSTDTLRPVDRNPRTLKCTCPAYRQQGYTCEHITAVLDAAEAGMFDMVRIQNTITSLRTPVSTTAEPTYNGRDYSSQEVVNVSAFNHILAAYVANPTFQRRMVSNSILNQPGNRINSRRDADAAALRQINEEGVISISSLPTEASALIHDYGLARARQRAATPVRRGTSSRRDTSEDNTAIAHEQNRHAERMREIRAENPATFTNNPTDFANIVAEVKRKRVRKMSRIPFVRDSEPGEITGGICAPEPGARKFGIELEFSLHGLSSYDKTRALQRIGEQLHAASLTTSSRQAGYHSGARSGWANWSFEYDGTVDGEIVSPVLSDTPEAWEQIRKVCEIIKSNGGKTDTRTGSHVHISTGSYAHNTEKYTNIGKTLAANQKLLFEIGKNHDRGSHRGTNWCSPNILNSSGELRYPSSNTHTAAINFGGANSSRANRRNAHTEFRFWDATLEPAIIQQQVAISAGIADYSEASANANERIATQRKEFRTSAFTNRVADDFTPSPTHETSISFLDNVLPTKKMRERAAELFGIV